MYRILRRRTSRHVTSHAWFPFFSDFHRISYSIFIFFQAYQGEGKRKGTAFRTGSSSYTRKGNTKVARAALCINRFHQHICFQQTNKVHSLHSHLPLHWSILDSANSFDSPVDRRLIFHEREGVSFSCAVFRFWVIASWAGR